MKKILIITLHGLATLVLLALLVLVVNHAAISSSYRQGDANHDGWVNMTDIVFIERIILQIQKPNPDCDVNQNGEIDMGDVITVERIILGLPVVYPGPGK